LQIDENNALGLAETRAADTLFFGPPLAGKNVGQRQAEHAGTTDAEQLAAGHCAVTGIFAALTGDYEHIKKPPSRFP
jgi:hypothetical protein